MRDMTEDLVGLVPPLEESDPAGGDLLEWRPVPVGGAGRRRGRPCPRHRLEIQRLVRVRGEHHGVPAPDSHGRYPLPRIPGGLPDNWCSADRGRVSSEARADSTRECATEKEE